MARFYALEANQPGFLAPGDYFASLPGAVWRNTTVVGTDTQTISPTVVNTALFSFNRTNNTNTPIYPPKGLAALGANMYNDRTPEIYLQVNGYFLLDTNDTNTFFRQELQVNDTLRWTKGRYQISIGAEYGHGLGDINNDYRANGYFTFDGAAPFYGGCIGRFHDRQVLQSGARRWRVQEHAFQHPVGVPGGFVPAYATPDAGPGAALGSIFSVHGRPGKAGNLCHRLCSILRSYGATNRHLFFELQKEKLNEARLVPPLYRKTSRTRLGGYYECLVP
jgi:hypothetical protein